MTGYQIPNEPPERKSLLRRAVTPHRLMQAFALAVMIDVSFNEGRAGQSVLSSLPVTETAGKLYGGWGFLMTDTTKRFGLYDLVTSPFRKDYY